MANAAQLRRELLRLKQEFLTLEDEVKQELQRIYAPAREEEARRYGTPERVRGLQAQQEQEAQAARLAAAAKLAPLSEEFDKAKARVDDVYSGTFEAFGDGGHEDRQNVQRLLDQGVLPAAIIERAAETADGIVQLKALRAELPWLSAAGSLGANLFEPNDLAGVLETTDEMLAQVSTGDEGEAMKEAVQLAGTVDVAARAHWIAVEATTGGGTSGENRLSLAFAEGAAAEGGE